MIATHNCLLVYRLLKTLITDCSKRSQRRGARKIDPSASLKTGSPAMVERGKCITPLLHHSTIPVSGTLERGD
jgi:hypothetical protein